MTERGSQEGVLKPCIPVDPVAHGYREGSEHESSEVSLFSSVGKTEGGWDYIIAL